MSVTEVAAPRSDAEDTHRSFDVIIVGAGWAGLYSLIKARELGLRAVVLEAGGGVGGTWYWNRYPGCRCDVPSLNYSFSFDEQLQQEWHWTERYASQAEIERYANHIVERFGLEPHIRLRVRVTGATWDDHSARWTVVTEAGEQYSAQYVIFATGGYSEPVEPTIPGWRSFAGETYFTARWPQHEVEYRDKRIGVIGTGSSGAQTITALSREPVRRLTVFQRTPNFVVPAHNRPMSPEEEAAIKKDYAAYRQRARMSGSGTVYEGPVAAVADMTDEEFEQHMEALLRVGGTSVLGGISDLLTNPKANERVQEYLRREIRRRVHNPEVAEKLTPRGYYLGSRRVIIENGYLEAFNLDHVELVDVKADPIVEITPEGVRTTNNFYPLDMLIFATGFDSGTGALLKIDVRGRDGIRLADEWSAGPVTYIGLAIAGFPNMFCIAGPGSPSIRSNVIVSIEQHVEWLADLLSYAARHGADVIEATARAAEQWSKHVADMVANTMLAKDDTQYWGANVPGKPRVYLAYIGGVGAFRTICDDIRDRDYEGFIFRDAKGNVVGDRSPEWSGPRRDGSIKTRFGTPII
jgi:cation diffusion facilitator CzcD-associated flavoprotein CzcO